jgi:hypothetical protein
VRVHNSIKAFQVAVCELFGSNIIQRRRILAVLLIMFNGNLPYDSFLIIVQAVTRRVVQTAQNHYHTLNPPGTGGGVFIHNLGSFTKRAAHAARIFISPEPGF